MSRTLTPSSVPPSLSSCDGFSLAAQQKPATEIGEVTCSVRRISGSGQHENRDSNLEVTGPVTVSRRRSAGRPPDRSRSSALCRGVNVRWNRGPDAATHGFGETPFSTVCCADRWRAHLAEHRLIPPQPGTGPSPWKRSNGRVVRGAVHHSTARTPSGGDQHRDVSAGHSGGAVKLLTESKHQSVSSLYGARRGEGSPSHPHATAAPHFRWFLERATLRFERPTRISRPHGKVSSFPITDTTTISTDSPNRFLPKPASHPVRPSEAQTSSSRPSTAWP